MQMYTSGAVDGLRRTKSASEQQLAEARGCNAPARLQRLGAVATPLLGRNAAYPMALRGQRGRAAFQSARGTPPREIKRLAFDTQAREAERRLRADLAAAQAAAAALEASLQPMQEEVMAQCRCLRCAVPRCGVCRAVWRICANVARCAAARGRGRVPKIG
jgi:hypothetical protein